MIKRINVLTKILTVIALCVLSLSAFAFFSSCGQKYWIQVNADGLAIDGKTINVNYGDRFTVPYATITNSSGKTFDVEVKYKLIDEYGKDITKKARIFVFDNDTTFTLTYYTVDANVKVEDVNYDVVCKDTVAPEISVMPLQNTYLEGDTFVVGINNISDASGVNHSLTTIRLIYESTGETIPLSNYTCQLNRLGKYELRIYAEDNVGNGGEYVHSFEVVRPYSEPNIKYTIWGFEDSAALSNILTTSNNEVFDFSITDEKTDDSLKSLKIDIKDEQTFEAVLVNGNPILISETGVAYIRIFATGLVDTITLKNTSNARSVLFDYYVLKNEWIDLKFDLRDLCNEEDYFDNVKITIWAEESATIYIDGIYYTDFVPAWQDENIGKDLLADFDEEEYAYRISSVTSVDYSTFGGSCFWLGEGTSDIPAGADGGVLKFSSTTDPSNTGVSRDGFYYSFDTKIKRKVCKGLLFKIYVIYVATEDVPGKPPLVLQLSFDTDMGTSTYIWNDVVPKNGWQYLLVSDESLARGIDEDATYITGMNIRIEKFTDAELTCYFDSIQQITKTREEMLRDNDFNYDYSSLNDNDMFGAISGGIVYDEEASDGYALTATTVYADAPGSGIVVFFNNIDITKYDSIIVRLKTTATVYFSFNGQDAVYYSNEGETGYCDYDILQLIRTYSPTLTTLTSFSALRSQYAGINIYIDKITFTEKQEHNFDFSSPDDDDVFAVSVSGNYVNNQIVKDADCPDGYALKILSTPNAGWNQGKLLIALNKAESVNAYKSIDIRIKVDSGASTYLFTDTSEGHGMPITSDGEYHTYNLLSDSYFVAGGTILMLDIQDIANGSHFIYIDYIEFVAE